MAHRTSAIFTGLAFVVLSVICGGCGGGQEPDKPAELTPEIEQKILDDAKAASQAEAGQPK